MAEEALIQEPWEVGAVMKEIKLPSFETFALNINHSINNNLKWWSTNFGQLRKQLRKLKNNSRKTSNMLDWDSSNIINIVLEMHMGNVLK